MKKGVVSLVWIIAVAAVAAFFISIIFNSNLVLLSSPNTTANISDYNNISIKGLFDSGFTINDIEGESGMINDLIIVNDNDEGRILQVTSIPPGTSTNDYTRLRDIITNVDYDFSTGVNNKTTSARSIGGAEYHVGTDPSNSNSALWTVKITWGPGANSGSAAGHVGSQITMFPRISTGNGTWVAILGSNNITNGTIYSLPSNQSFNNYKTGFNLTNSITAQMIENISYGIFWCGTKGTITNVTINGNTCSFDDNKHTLLFIDSVNGHYCNTIYGQSTMTYYCYIDAEAPQFTNQITTPPNNSFYSLAQIIKMTINITRFNGTGGIELDGKNYTITNLTFQIYNRSSIFLKAGDHSFYFWGYGNGTSHLYNTSTVYSYTIRKAYPLLMLSCTSPINLGTTTDCSGSENNLGDGDLTYSVSPNNRNYYSGNVNFNYSTAGGQNYTANSTIKTVVIIDPCTILKNQYGSGSNKDSCADTDGGNLPNSAGIVYGFAKKNWYCAPDKCSNPGAGGTQPITEYYCSGTKVVYKSYSCSKASTKYKMCGSNGYANMCI